MISKYIDLNSIIDSNSLKLLLDADDFTMDDMAFKYGIEVFCSESHVPLYITLDNGDWYHHYPSNIDKLNYSYPPYEHIGYVDESFTCFYFERGFMKEYDHYQIILISDKIPIEKMKMYFTEIIKNQKLLTFA